jgi:hypothetical protein
VKVSQISAELSSDIVAISELVQDQSISDSDRSQKLTSLKTSIVEKIDAESDAVSFAGRSYLEEIKAVISNEEWAKLPPTTTIKNELLAIRSLVTVLNSLENDRGPMMEAIQRLLTEALLKQLNSLSDSEILSLSKQWGAAELQFEKARDSADAERTSALITAGVGIGTALASLAAKAVVTYVSNNQFKNAAPTEQGKNSLNRVRSEQSEAELKLNNVSKKMSELDTELAATRSEVNQLKQDLANKKVNSAERTSKEKELKQKTTELNDLQKRRDDLTPEYDRLKTDYKVASKVADRTGAEIERSNAEASRSVQQFRALLDMTDSAGSVLQNISKILTISLFDSKASDYKIQSDEASFMANFFSSVMQNSQKSQSQTSDGIASIRSTCDASIQAYDGSITATIRA